ncbi:type II toxin-antitoxin system RelE/ParE family toxin [Aidingimonas lacisalsi]|uniref:type II toxin-antitoxin system RelE/ParE family toxin n=1 Tax=Aidingimonas lacisalsi TaxID=2604086 RepID=UPI0011D25D8D|nr:type II toxin-antitoxin system RelE/ParE family toxin [Aidingimonas lacisalsi]
MPEEEKPIEFRGDSLDRLRDFPTEAKQTAGYELGRVQQGKMPDHYRPMPDVGRGVIEIKIRDAKEEPSKGSHVIRTSCAVSVR